MKQYISKSALVVEIEKRKGMCDNHYGDYWNGCYNTFTDILSFIDTLEVKAEDLEKELDYEDYMNFFKEHPDYNKGDWGFDECWVFAKHFYELGLKAKEK